MIMNKLQHVIASPRGARSHSRQLADFFINEIEKVVPGLDCEEVELFSIELPEFSSAGASAKFKASRDMPLTSEEQEQWEGAKSICRQFKSADAWVFSIPMWNFGVPYKLKHYLDLITQPGWLFDVSESGYTGMLSGKKALAVYSCGGFYETPTTASLDSLRPYMRIWANLVGIELHEVCVHSTNLDVDHDKIDNEVKASLDDLQQVFFI
jgi:FMN-dependent NADH-azoreductase